MKKKPLSVIFASAFLCSSAVNADHVILDDCIIDGSLAVGLDAVNGENFGFDTIRIKENNLRFHFDDTSTAAAFPRNDWRLIANDSANGGDEYLGIEDSTAGRIPFRVEKGARNHALFIESSGDVGIGTNNPVTDIHISTGDTPTVRLEQNGTSGWTPQTWDVSGNETNFFIRDVTHGSKLPFRIRPDAPTSSLEVEASGNVKLFKSLRIGSTVPELRLEIPSSGADFPGMKVASALISGDGNGFIRASLSNNTWHDGTGWQPNAVDSVGGVFQIRDNLFAWHKTSAGVGTPTFTKLMELTSSGNLDILGAYGMISDKNKKADIEQVDTAAVLEKLAEIPIATWRYKTDEDVFHMGPMAQDFWGAFKLGHKETVLSLGDSSAVALASAQELYKRVQEKEERIQELEKQNEELVKRLERIEKALNLAE